ncbi:MAG: sporulation protein YunB, partial [Longicatena sp.]
YDSARLNQILYTALNTIDASLLAAQDGRKDPTTKDVFYEDGVLYEVPMGYFSHLYFLYEKGPKVKIKMKMMNDVTGEIKTETKPYGINNTMVKISLVVHVNAQVLTFLSTSELNNKCEIPIIIQVVNGSVPNISPYGSTKE